MQFWAFYRILRRWRWVVVVLCLLVPSLVGLLTYFQPRVYLAGATIYTPEESRRDIVTQGTEVRSVETSQGDLIRLLTTRAFWTEVQPQLQAERLSYALYTRRLKTQTTKGNMVDVSWMDDDQDRGVASLNTIVDAFVEFYKNQQTAEIVNTRQLLEQQLADSDAELRQAEQALVEFQRTNQLPDTSSIATVRQQYDALIEKKKTADVSIQQAQARAGALAGQASRTSEFTESSKKLVPNPDAELLRASLMQAKSQLLEALQKYRPEHPTVVRLQESVKAIEDQLEKTEPIVEGEKELARNENYQGISKALSDAQTEVAGLIAQRDGINSQITELQGRLVNLPGMSTQLDQLTRTRDRLQKKYEEISTVLSETRITEYNAQQRATIRIIDRAAPPLPQVNKKLMFKVVVSLVATFGFCLMTIFLIEQTDNRIKGPADVERLLHIRTFAALPLLPAESTSREMLPEEMEDRRLRLATFREAIRSLRSHLFLVQGDPQPRVLGVVSAQSGVGKTTIAMNLAESLANAGHRTLLIDADLRAPTVHSVYEIPNRIGLSSILENVATADEAIQTVDVPGLYVLPAGPLLEDPSVVLGTELLRPMIDALRDRYSWIIVDTPSGLAYTDAIVTSTVLDGVVMVTAAGVISRGSEDRLMGDFDNVGTAILGAVVNKVLPQNADTLYHYQHYRRATEADLPDDREEPPTDAPAAS